MNVGTLISRARSALGKGTKYRSPGVTPSLNAATWPTSGARIDCSGFLAWCLRVSRVVDHPMYRRVNGGWFETTGIHADVVNAWGYFDRLLAPVPGAFVVYPDRDGHDGHIGLITEVTGDNGVRGIRQVIHCSLGASNAGDAISETGANIWRARNDSVIGWHVSVV